MLCHVVSKTISVRSYFCCAPYPFNPTPPLPLRSSSLIPEECLVAAIELRSGLALVPRKENSEMALPAWFGLVW
jgi:hypothetical protein